MIPLEDNNESKEISQNPANNITRIIAFNLDNSTTNRSTYDQTFLPNNSMQVATTTNENTQFHDWLPELAMANDYLDQPLRDQDQSFDDLKMRRQFKAIDSYGKYEQQSRKDHISSGKRGACSSGFKSPLPCNGDLKCPSALACDPNTQFCCPILPSPAMKSLSLPHQKKHQYRKYPRGVFGKFKPTNQQLVPKRNGRSSQNLGHFHSYRQIYANNGGTNANVFSMPSTGISVKVRRS